ncbi:MAG: isochorismate synthase [Balneolaceae bacterium]
MASSIDPDTPSRLRGLEPSQPGLFLASPDEIRDFLPDGPLDPALKWISWSTPVGDLDPLIWIEQQMDRTQDLFYWEKPDEETVIAATGTAAELMAEGEDRFESIGQQIRDLNDHTLSISPLKHSMARPLLLGGYAFDDRSQEHAWASFGSARFVMPRRTLVRIGSLHLLTLTLPVNEDPLREIIDRFRRELTSYRTQREQQQDSETDTRTVRRPVSIQSTATPNERIWKEQVREARDQIRNGDYDKVVLSRQLLLESNHPLSATRALYHFREQFSDCTNFLIRSGDSPLFLGASPERLVSLNRNRIHTDGLAGSTARGASAGEDDALGQSLMKSPKERSEHQYVVREILDQLRPFTLEIDHPKQPRLKKLHNVQHLYTPITAQANREMSVHDLARTLHPTPAVGGTPRKEALQTLTRLEPFGRGWYSGPIGWSDLNGNGEFCVAIRSALIDGPSARLFAGSGIVADSDPDREWEETNMKFRPILEALKPVGSHEQ